MTSNLFTPDELDAANERLSTPTPSPSPLVSDLDRADAAIQERKRLERFSARGNVLQSSAVSPTVRGESLDLSKRSGLPVDLVERNMDRVRSQTNLELLDWANIEHRKGLKALFSGPAAPIAIKDAENFQAIAQSIPIRGEG